MVVSPHIAACQEAIDLFRRQTIHLQPVESLDQLQELFAIDAEAYQECSLEFEVFRQWWERYPLGSRVLLADGQIAASIGIYPLYSEQFAAFQHGKIPEQHLRPVTLAECEFKPARTWYASGIVVATQLRGWGSPLGRLMRGGLSEWLNSGHIAYPLEILAIAEYDEGRKLLELLGFCKVRVGAELPDGCDLYKVQFENYEQALSLVQRVRH